MMNHSKFFSGLLFPVHVQTRFYCMPALYILICIVYMNDAVQICKQTAHARNVWTYFAFTCMLLMRVHVRIYASLLFILISFSMWSIDGQTKDVSGMKKHQVLMQICRHFEKCQWKLYFEFSVALCGHQQTTVLLTLDWSRAAKKLRRKLKQLLKLLILANFFMEYYIWYLLDRKQ